MNVRHILGILGRKDWLWKYHNLKRHVASYRDLTNHEKEAINVVQEYVMKKIDERFHPDGYNVGINIGKAAGQSVFHCHMHVIPRYNGDVPNPKGGVRGVIPSKQKY